MPMYDTKQDDSHLAPFCLPAGRKAEVSLSERPISVADLVYRFNEAIDPRRMRLLKIAELEEALVQNGYFVYRTGNDGLVVKTPSEKAEKLGVMSENKRLSGGGEVTAWYLKRPLQQDILLHINALLGRDAALDAGFPQKTAQTVPESKPTPSAPPTAPAPKQEEKPAHFRYCWNCEGKIPARFTFPCPSCGWPICPKCGACRSPRMGGCPETKKGMGRFTGLLKEKNDLRTRLLNNKLLSVAAFDDLRQVNSPDDLLAFRRKYADLLQHLETIREENRELREKESADKVREAKLNQRGFYKIVSVSPRLVTYQTANGIKKSIPNQPPVRTGKEYVDLTGIDPSLR